MITAQELQQMMDVGYFSTQTGSADLLKKLYEAVDPSNPPTNGCFEYLGSSRNGKGLFPDAKPVEFNGIRINGWVIGSNKSHIVPLELVDKISEEAQVATPPEMVFGNNQLVFFHEKTGICINFLAVEALRGAHFKKSDAYEEDEVNAREQLKIAAAKEKRQAGGIKELSISYDWTFTTDYQGNAHRLVEHHQDTGFHRAHDVSIESTNLRIDIEKLKERETILWFDDVPLFEDELHDNGISVMSVKVRVMPSGFFCLARFWLRLDNVQMRLYETRIHHVFGSCHLLREFQRREATFESLFASGKPRSMAHYLDVDTAQQCLSVVELRCERILLQ